MTAKQCEHRRELYRIGRGVVETRQCGNTTNHPTKLCYLHRSDPED